MAVSVVIAVVAAVVAIVAAAVVAIVAVVAVVVVAVVSTTAVVDKAVGSNSCFTLVMTNWFRAQPQKEITV